MEDILNSSIDALQERAYALDTLGKLALLAMTFYSLIPFHVLSAGMYHSEKPRLSVMIAH